MKTKTIKPTDSSTWTKNTPLSEKTWPLPVKFRAKWIKDLESGKNKQCLEYLCLVSKRDKYSLLPLEYSYCCLGRAEIVAGNSNDDILSESISCDCKVSMVPSILQEDINELKRKKDFASFVAHLVKLNDGGKCPTSGKELTPKSFKQIAKFIRKHTYPTK